MTRICWRLAEFASQALQPKERDAVLGDFAESGESGGEALCGVLGLVARRQAALWKHWRPWLVLVGLVVPLAWLLSIASRLVADTSAVYLWSYLNNWEWGLLKYASFWYILRDSIGAVLLRWVILACSSWSVGFLVGWLSRHIVPTNCLLFCLFAVIAEVLGVSRYLACWFPTLVHSPSSGDPNGPVFALAFYREAFPIIVLAALVMVPLLWAMRYGAGLRQLPTVIRVLLLAVASVAVITMTIQQPGLGFFLRAYRPLALLRGWPRALLQFLIYWPIAYLLVSALTHRFHKESTT
jgi:hypothetical protein